MGYKDKLIYVNEYLCYKDIFMFVYMWGLDNVWVYFLENLRIVCCLNN